MIRILFGFILCSCLCLQSACSKRERSDPDAEEWQTIEALADEPDLVPEIEPVVTNSAPVSEAITTALPGEFNAFIRRLEQMKTVKRAQGQTLIEGERLIFDHDERYVQMDQDVVVTDDQGTLETEHLIGRFSVSNEVEYIEAQDGVVIRSEGREAVADQAVYNYQTGFIELEGMATVSDSGKRLSGERIQFWIKTGRKIICEPNALLEIHGASGFKLNGISSSSSSADGVTELRANRAVYDELKGEAELVGNVRIRDPHFAMNCGIVRLYLKDDNEIDWIEALSEVIIQMEDRKALADRVTYRADEGKITMEGNPKVKKGRNTMTGDRITYWLETRHMVCKPNARLLLYLDAMTKAKFLKDLDD